ncbi:MAG: class III extradiol ring-cleavage dioxygenase [Actinomycetes bacterium]|jgi:4,5-DOPA dioxygenase extradiol
MSEVNIDRAPALYIGHGAPPLLDDPGWSGELVALAAGLPRPRAILVVSAHWEAAPLSLSATGPATPLVYDFGGFPDKFYQMTYPTPDAAELARLVASVLPDTESVHQHSSRGLDHGAWVPLTIMYPDADIPVLQLSLPTLEPSRLLELGRRLRPLRDHGVLILGSGFLTHGLQHLREWRIEATPPGWSVDFDLWAAEALKAGDIDSLINFRSAPGMPYAHPTAEHLAPLFVALGASEDPTASIDSAIDGYWMGLSKRSYITS